MSKYEGFTELTFEELVEARCKVSVPEDGEREFKNFIMVGFDEDEEGEQYCVTAAKLSQLYLGIKTLQTTFKRALQQAPEDVKRELEAEVAIDKVIFGEDEEDD